jgi:hypothetical protein
MRYQIKTQVAAVASCLFWAMIFVPVINAQEKPEITAANARANHNQQHVARTQSTRKMEKFPEFEVAASDQFRSAGIVAPLSRRLNIEGYYFGVRIESELEERLEQAAKRRSGFLDVGAITASHSFRLGRRVALSPGFGVFFGEGQKTSPAFTFRWEVEKGRLFSQGLFIQSLQTSEEFGRVRIWDGNHVSIRLSRFEFGPSWEWIHIRVENEWKGGGRTAFRILTHLSAVFFILAPKTEYRGGIIIHPKR